MSIRHLFGLQFKRNLGLHAGPRRVPVCGIRPRSGGMSKWDLQRLDWKLWLHHLSYWVLLSQYRR